MFPWWSRHLVVLAILLFLPPARRRQLCEAARQVVDARRAADQAEAEAIARGWGSAR